MHYLRTTTYFAAFFGDGVRANNTSVHTAMQAGAVVITNMDDRSPEGFNHMQSVIDIRSCSELPASSEVLHRISSNAQKVCERYGWEPLVRHLIECDERPNMAPRAATGPGLHGERPEAHVTSARP